MNLTKKYILATLLLAGSGQAEATDIAGQERADSAYNAGRYDEAAELYQNIIQRQGASAGLYYNLGNSYYRTGKTAQAVIAYERALKLDPTDANAKANLNFVNSKLIDKKGYEGSFFTRTATDITNICTSNTWAWIALLLFVLTMSAIALYIFSSEVILRKLGFFGGGATLFTCIITILLALNAYKLTTTRSTAIVKTASAILSTVPRSPQNQSEEAMLLHEGARLTILDSITSPTDSIKKVWYDVEFDNEHRAWINSSDVEII